MGHAMVVDGRQQLAMESNGQGVTLDGAPVGTQASASCWGEPGTNGYPLRTAPTGSWISKKAMAPRGCEGSVAPKLPRVEYIFHKQGRLRARPGPVHLTSSISARTAAFRARARPGSAGFDAPWSAR